DITLKQITDYSTQAQQLIIETRVATDNTRVCIEFDAKGYNHMINLFRQCKEKNPSLHHWNAVNKFIELMKTKWTAIAKEDQEFYNFSLLEASADVFESLEFYLKKIFEQMVL